MYDELGQYRFNTFVWGPKTDIIGAGATSIVYKAICTETGEFVAVKVFNDAAKSRSNILQSRELDLLLKINHENVVKLIDRDESSNNGKYSLKLLVMEYCNGGSLSSIIEQPENIYGLQQSEFLLVLKNITCGMNELHKLKIVHRDIKPNNILLQIMPNGEHVYKLSDFGAARQVEMEDDQFTSICGTEEYLFPDVYERALINRNLQKSFKAGIDLWSTGVTIYHVATGLLPFRPIGGRLNRETMIKITKDKPSGAISGVQNPHTGQIEYSDRLPDTCQLSETLQELIIPMLAGLMENNYDSMWPFQKFFEESSKLCNLAFINVLNLDQCQLIELPFRKQDGLKELKEKIELYTKIDKSSQLIIYNNLLFDSLVTEQQKIESYPTIDRDHPLVLFSLNNILCCDNNNIIKSIPTLRCKSSPKSMNEIILWAKETSGSVHYIKREVYLITKIIELLKLSAVAFKSYMPEMKLKQQHLLYNFNSTIKSLETKLSIVEKLKNFPILAQNEQNDMEIKNDIRKFKSAISNYETEINILTEKINCTQDLDFFVENCSLSSKWKKEIDQLTAVSQGIFEELNQTKKEVRSKYDQEKFEKNKLIEFKVRNELKAKESAVKLYQETIIIHFVDYYSRFEKWMSDLIKLHNELMSVHQKLIECEKSLNSPVDDIETHLDMRIGNMLESLLRVSHINHNHSNRSDLITPPVSAAHSEKSSVDMRDDFNNNINIAKHTTSTYSISSLNNLGALATSLRKFKDEANEIEKMLDENAGLLK